MQINNYEFVANTIVYACCVCVRPIIHNRYFVGVHVDANTRGAF